MKLYKVAFGALFVAWLGGCSEQDGVGQALALAKIDMAAAIGAAKAELGGAYALEVEFVAEEGAPIFDVELLDGGEVVSVTIDGVEGTVLERQEIVSSELEKVIIDAIEDLGREGRIGLLKALKRGAEIVGGGTPIEVDVEQDGRGPIFVIVYAVGDARREAVVAIAKEAPPVPAAPAANEAVDDR